MRRALILTSLLTLFLLLLFRVFDWECGVERAAIVMTLIGILVATSMTTWKFEQPSAAYPIWPLPLVVAGTLLLLIEIGVGISSIVYSAQTGDIKLDQGQNTYRAAVFLREGRNPYGFGVLLDVPTYFTRLELRKDLGIGPTNSGEEFNNAFARYWTTLDPAAERTLLPLPAPDAPATVWREESLLGYKYGPAIPMMVAPLVGLIGPAAVPGLNLLAFLAWVAALWATVFASPLPDWSRAIILTAALAILEIPWNFLLLSATDIWPLLFSTLAVWALITGRPTVMGVSLGLAFGCKWFPSALYVPLLFLTRSVRAWIAMLLVIAAVYFPFLVWDAKGVYFNIVRWPSLMQPDSTSWLFWISPTWAIAARFALATAMVILWWRVLKMRDAYLFRALALSNLLIVLTGAAFHNNYVPWFAPWIFLALAEILTRTETLMLVRSGQGAVPRTPELHRNWGVGFIAWLGLICFALQAGNH